MSFEIKCRRFILCVVLSLMYASLIGLACHIGQQSGFHAGVRRGKAAALKEVFQAHLASVTSQGFPRVMPESVEEGFLLETQCTLITNSILINFSEKGMFALKHDNASVVMQGNYHITFVPGLVGRSWASTPDFCGSVYQTIEY